MSTERGFSTASDGAGALPERVVELRQARAGLSVGADPAVVLATLDAALLDLDMAVATLQATRQALAECAGSASRRDGASQERRLLRAVVRELPTPVLVLEGEGVVRRVNQAAARLLEVPAGYATGRPLQTFVDLSARAVLGAHLAAVGRDGRPRTVRTTLVAGGRRIGVELSLVRLDQVAGDRPLLAAVATPTVADSTEAELARLAQQMDQAPAEPDGARRAEVDPALISATLAVHPSGRPDAAEVDGDGPRATDDAVRPARHGVELMSRFVRAVLSAPDQDEAVVLDRGGRVLLDGLADWLVVDLAVAGGLRRALVADAGEPAGGRAGGAALAAADPAGCEPCQRVWATGEPLYLAHIERADLLGRDEDGMPLLTRLDVVSLLAAPLRAHGHVLGVAVLLRSSGRPPFTLAEQSLAEEFGELWGLVLDLGRNIPEGVPSQGG